MFCSINLPYVGLDRCCLILGFNTVGDPIHSVWNYDEVSQIAKLVTVYRPDRQRWINWSIQK